MGILRFCITFTVRKSRKSENKKSIGIKRIREELRMSGISRNIRYVMGCLLLLFAMGCRAEAAEAGNADAGAATLQQTTQYAELKEAPDAKSSTLEKLDEGTAVIVEETEDAWSRVRYKEKEGYLPNGALDSYDVGPVEELNREFQEVGENNVRIVDEYELVQQEKHTSMIWGAVIAVLVAGIFAAGIVSALRKNKEGEQQ